MRFYLQRYGAVRWQYGRKRLQDLLRQLNHGAREDLQRVPGLGPTKGNRLLTERDKCVKVGMTLGDILAMPGFGANVLVRMSGDDPHILNLLKYMSHYQEVTSSSRVTMRRLRDYLCLCLCLCLMQKQYM